jgi:hypothetical protein
MDLDLVRREGLGSASLLTWQQKMSWAPAVSVLPSGICCGAG